MKTKGLNRLAEIMKTKGLNRLAEIS